MQEETIKAEELERAWKEARSLCSESDKKGFTYLGIKQVGDRQFFFYLDGEGNYWYETDYDRERREWEKEKKKRQFQLKYGMKGERYGANTKKF